MILLLLVHTHYGVHDRAAASELRVEEMQRHLAEVNE